MEHDVKLFILCSPPIIWKEGMSRSGEIQRVLDICKKHHVHISDESYQDIIMKDHEHVVAATTGTYDDMLVTLAAGRTKTFNLRPTGI